MRQQLERRLEELKAEYEAGQQMLADLETRKAQTRETLLRISGAIQVLEEELSSMDSGNVQSNSTSNGEIPVGDAAPDDVTV